MVIPYPNLDSLKWPPEINRSNTRPGFWCGNAINIWLTYELATQGNVMPVRGVSVMAVVAEDGWIGPLDQGGAARRRVHLTLRAQPAFRAADRRLGTGDLLMDEEYRDIKGKSHGKRVKIDPATLMGFQIRVFPTTCASECCWTTPKWDFDGVKVAPWSVKEIQIFNIWQMCKHGWQLQNYVISEMQTETVNQTLPSESLSNKTSKGITDIYRQTTSHYRCTNQHCHMLHARGHYHYSLSLYYIYISLFIVIIYHYSLSMIHYSWSFVHVSLSLSLSNYYYVIYSWSIIHDYIYIYISLSPKCRVFRQVTGPCERPWTARGTTPMAPWRCWIIRSPMRSSGRSSLDHVSLCRCSVFFWGGRYNWYINYMYNWYMLINLLFCWFLVDTIDND